MVVEDRYTQWAKGLGRRQGIGEFVDAGGVMPRLFGRLQYLAAMALELKRERPLVQLVDIWSPCVDAMLLLERAMKSARCDAEGTVPAPPPVPDTVRAILAPIADVLGIPLPIVLRALMMGPAYRSLPETSQVLKVANDALFRAFHSHAEWMQRWGLPRDDVGWCLLTVSWGALWSLEAAIRSRKVTPASPAAPHQVPPLDLADAARPNLALFYPEMNQMLADLLHTVELPSTEDLPVAIGRWVAALTENMFGTSASVTVPSHSWNPWLESRALAEKRIRAATKRTIEEQFDATEAQLTARGAKQTPNKSSGLTHFRWLVRQRVKRQTPEEIALTVKPNAHAVRNALKETRNLIVLPPLPPGPRPVPAERPLVG